MTSLSKDASVDKPEVIELEDVGLPVESNAPGVPNDGQTPHFENKLTFSFFMTMLGLSMTFVAAEVVPLFLITLFSVIAYSLHASSYSVWLITSQFVAIGAVAPFVGTLSDLLGRKIIVLVSLVCTVIAMIIIGTTPNIVGMIAGQVIGGIGIGIQLLTTIAAATELVPTYRRGITIGYIVCGFFPFSPASLYGQYLAVHSWRWIAAVVGVWAAAAFVVLAIFYHPPPRANSLNLSKRELVSRIDFMGSFLSLAGLVLFLTGLNWGGQHYPWNSTHVISTLTVGLILLVVFFVWEKYGTKYPMFPMALARSPRPFVAVCILCLTSGINYVPLVVFWTTQAYTVYGASFHQAGVYMLPIGFCIAGGAIISAMLITVFRTKIYLILMLFCIIQTAGLGSMAAVDPENISTVWAPMILGLIGVGGVLLPSQVIFSIITPDELIGTGVALSIVVRMVGQVVGVAMFYNIFVQQVTKNTIKYFALPAISVGVDDVASITSLVTALTAGPFSSYVELFPQINTTEKYNIIIQAEHELFKHCYPILYLISVAFGGAAIFSAFFLSDINQFIDDHVAVALV